GNNVRFWHLADIDVDEGNVCFRSMSTHQQACHDSRSTRRHPLSFSECSPSFPRTRRGSGSERTFPLPCCVSASVSAADAVCALRAPITVKDDWDSMPSCGCNRHESPRSSGVKLKLAVRSLRVGART